MRIFNPILKQKKITKNHHYLLIIFHSLLTCQCLKYVDLFLRKNKPKKSGNMAKRAEFELSVDERRRRHCSDNFKLNKVKELESRKTNVSENKKNYQVSYATIYRWIAKFGTIKDKPERLVLETESDTKELIALKQKVAELEKIIGQKQILLDFKDKMIEIAEQTYGIDIKKKPTTSVSNTSGRTESSIDGN